MEFDFAHYYLLKVHGRGYHSPVGRYISFVSYPHTAKAYPTRLCETGCYYTGFQDEVKCHVCTFTYRGWNEGDIPEEKHRRHSPECQFLIGNDVITAGIGDIQIEDIFIDRLFEETNNDFITLHERPDSGMSKENKEKVESMNNRELNVQNAGAKTMNTFLHTGTRGLCENGDTRGDNDTAGADAMPFEEYSARLRSYKQWPKRQIADPQMLANAGFYYTGRGDIIRCYKCRFEIRNLNDGLDPWEEHARLYPYCDHLVENKGELYVQRFHQNPHGRDAEQTVPKERRGRAHFQKKRDELYGSDQCDTKCKKCLRRESDVVFLPCRHLVCCRLCADDCSVCIFCSSPIMGKRRIYR
ncbi:inhibitor of apoptosis protein-like [Mercenaria mercenaria]|uniref:inhibitor of apoptosis protein-like n=1 Tax=Mercenaria mercenaria TaxID=6596 RepID=UPI00234F1B21|nr:inhibitor of apoptosis protein-like [Mercenaria mercenaria]